MGGFVIRASREDVDARWTVAWCRENCVIRERDEETDDYDDDDGFLAMMIG